VPAQRVSTRTAGVGGKNVVNLVEILLEALSKGSKQVPKLKPPKGVPSKEQVRVLEELGRKPGVSEQRVHIGKEARKLGVDPAEVQLLDEAIQKLPELARVAKDPSVLSGIAGIRKQAMLDQLKQRTQEFTFSILSEGRPSSGSVDRLIDAMITARKTGGKSREDIRKQFLDEFGVK
jgi:hypothetical protein